MCSLFLQSCIIDNTYALHSPSALAPIALATRHYLVVVAFPHDTTWQKLCPPMPLGLHPMPPWCFARSLPTLWSGERGGYRFPPWTLPPQGAGPLSRPPCCPTWPAWRCSCTSWRQWAILWGRRGRPRPSCRRRGWWHGYCDSSWQCNRCASRHLLCPRRRPIGWERLIDLFSIDLVTKVMPTVWLLLNDYMNRNLNTERLYVPKQKL